MTEIKDFELSVEDVENCSKVDADGTVRFMNIRDTQDDTKVYSKALARKLKDVLAKGSVFHVQSSIKGKGDKKSIHFACGHKQSNNPKSTVYYNQTNHQITKPLAFKWKLNCLLCIGKQINSNNYQAILTAQEPEALQPTANCDRNVQNLFEFVNSAVSERLMKLRDEFIQNKVPFQAVIDQTALIGISVNTACINAFKRYDNQSALNEVNQLVNIIVPELIQPVPPTPERLPPTPDDPPLAPTPECPPLPPAPERPSLSHSDTSKQGVPKIGKINKSLKSKDIKGKRLSPKAAANLKSQRNQLKKN